MLGPLAVSLPQIRVPIQVLAYASGELGGPTQIAAITQMLRCFDGIAVHPATSGSGTCIVLDDEVAAYLQSNEIWPLDRRACHEALTAAMRPYGRTRAANLDCHPRILPTPYPSTCGRASGTAMRFGSLRSPVSWIRR